MAKNTYESMITEIETLLDELDSKELSLDQGISKYKKGMELIKACSDKLDLVEKELRIIEDKE